MKNLKFLFIFSLCCILCSACDKENEPETAWQNSELCHKLAGKSWQLYSIINYWADGSEVSQSNRLRPQIYTFRNTPAYFANSTNIHQPYVLEMFDTNTNETKQSYWYLDEKYLWGMSSPSIMGEVVSLTSDCLQLRFDFDDPIGCGCDYSVSFYQRVY